jgi:hypothetical protein
MFGRCRKDERQYCTCMECQQNALSVTAIHKYPDDVSSLWEFLISLMFALVQKILNISQQIHSVATVAEHLVGVAIFIPTAHACLAINIQLNVWQILILCSW